MGDYKKEDWLTLTHNCGVIMAGAELTRERDNLKSEIHILAERWAYNTKTIIRLAYKIFGPNHPISERLLEFSTKDYRSGANFGANMLERKIFEIYKDKVLKQES